MVNPPLAGVGKRHAQNANRESFNIPLLARYHNRNSQESRIVSLLTSKTWGVCFGRRGRREVERSRNGDSGRKNGSFAHDELGELAEIKGGAVGPLLRHVRDNAARCGIARDFITTRKILRGPGGKQVSYYVLSPEIKQQVLEGARQQ